MPNLQGASLLDSDDGDRLYAARTTGKSGLEKVGQIRRCRGIEESSSQAGREERRHDGSRVPSVALQTHGRV